MSVCALAQDLPKFLMICCCGAELPSRSHGVRPRASVSIRSSGAGPQVCFSPVALLCRWRVVDLATHSFQIHRQRFHPASNAARAVDDARSRYVYRACPVSP